MTGATGNLIRDLRQLEGKTQQQLGRGAKITASRISKIESGLVKATIEEISAISHYFKSMEIIRVYLAESPLNETITKICSRLGVPPHDNSIELTIKQFSRNIADRANRCEQLCDPLPDDEGAKWEHIKLVGQEALAIGTLAQALRLLVCDIK